MNVRPGKYRRSPRARRRWAALVVAGLALPCAAPSSLLAEEDSSVLRVTFDGGDTMFLDPGLLSDTAVAGDPSWTILANTNNGLLAFKRSGGSDGTQLEPDLATKIPSPQDGGKTYVFEIRQGVKFSDDKAGEVKPSDIEWSLDRTLFLESQGRSFLMGIRGAAAAAKAGAEGGGISGITADDSRHTLTIQLTKPDPSFLKVLAMPWTFVVPKGTPLNDISTNSPPATGPYRIRRYEPDRLVQLVQNPNWDQNVTERDRTLPRRFSRIEVTIGVSPRDGLERIRGGEADLTLSPVLPADVAKFADRREVQIEKAHPLPSVVAFFMNTREKPFDNILVRQAVNIAVDRGVLADFFKDQAVETAQVLPPTYPAFRRQSVQKPNVKRAKELIRRANLTADDLRVTIWSKRDQPVIAISKYLKSVLVDLGFKADIKYLDSFVYEERIGQKDTNAQIGYVRWLATVPDGADLFRLLDGRAIRKEGNPNPSYYDKSDESIERARREPAGAKRDRAWAAVDAEVSKNVPWVPFANLTKSDMISSRLTNYVYSPVFGQLWSVLGTK